MNTTKKMRKDTIKFTLDRNFIRPKAYEVKQWLTEKVKISGNEVIGVHLSFVSNAAFVKLTSPELCYAIVDKCGGVMKFNHSDGTVSDIVVTHAGRGSRGD